jgi:hypothetical protein
MRGYSKYCFIPNGIMQKSWQNDRDKFTIEQAIKARRYSSTLSLTSANRRREWSTPRPGRFTPCERDPVSIVHEAKLAPGAFWTVAKKLAPTGIRSPDRPHRSESLYRLSYPWVSSVHKCARYTRKIHVKHHILISSNLRYPTTSVLRRCWMQQCLQ